MSKVIDLNQAESWSDEEAQENIAYLEQRGKLDDVNRIKEARGEEGSSTPAAASIEVSLDDGVQHTSSTGVNDTPEGQEEADKRARMGKGTDAELEPGLHGPNADQFDPEHGTKRSRAEATGGRKVNVTGKHAWDLGANELKSMAPKMRKDTAERFLREETDEQAGGQNRSTVVEALEQRLYGDEEGDDEE